MMTRQTVDEQRSHRRGQVLIVLSSIFWSTAGALQRELSVDTATQVAGRAAVASIVMVTLATLQTRESPVASLRRAGWPGFWFAVCMAGASGLFIYALNRTTVANVIFLQALAPLLAVGLAWLVMRERASNRSWCAMAIAVGGVAIMVGGPGGGPVIGFVAAALVALLFAVTIVAARHARATSMLPAVALGQVILVICAAPFADFGSITQHDLVVMVIMGVLQTGLGQLFFVMGARLIPTTMVALITLLEVVLAPVWVWMFHSETPGGGTLIGGAVVLMAVVLQSTEKTATPSPAPA